MLFLKKRTPARSNSSASELEIKYPYWRALRPRQWTKNLIIFAAPLFSFAHDLPTWLECCVAFGLFCCLSSSFYLINDLLDVKSDRQHPVKRYRPIASGKVSVPAAIAMAGVLLSGSLWAGITFDRGLGTALICYALLQVAYNLKFKHVAILDILAIATGFVLRAYAGAAAVNIILSSWFLICTAMLALFLGIEKRKAELRLAEAKGSKTRAVLQAYSLNLLSRMESTVTTGAVITYAIWSAGPQVNGALTPWMLLTLPFVLYGVFRYQLLSDAQTIEPGRELTERPEEVLLTDRPLMITLVGWVFTTAVVLALKHEGWIV
jgi:decaprenyl-phosphate phosphoribosyltransferase